MNWKRKLAAYLHDPPHKPFRIAGHEDARKSFCLEVGLDEDELKSLFERSSDHKAASADRIIFPDPKSSGVRTDWKQDADCAFHHPLCGQKIIPNSLPASTDKAEEWVHSALQGTGVKDDDSWETRWWKTWRLWPEAAARRNPILAYLVADTRIPNHTLWHHLGLVSAINGCGQQCSFMLFQIGPVQDFIRQARTTRDLWAGSYLLSFLIARAMFAVSRAVGPDSIVYPQLRGVPLIDWFGYGPEGQFWNEPLRASYKNRGVSAELLTPNLPNRFLALVPKDWRSDDGSSIAQVAKDAVDAAWKNIAGTVHEAIEARVGKSFSGWDQFWGDQIERFPVVDYYVHDWTDTRTVLAEAEAGTPPLRDGWEQHPLRDAFQWATSKIDRAHFDPRCYKTKSWQEGGSWKSQLLDADGAPLPEDVPPIIENQGFAWALHYAATEWKFAGVKNARPFTSWDSNARVEKDQLDGRNEVLGGEQHEAFWDSMRNADWGKDAVRRVFKGRQEYGALTTIKRLFPFVWLPEALNSKAPSFESVHDIAEAIDRDTEEGCGPDYYAILCMDGDDMGQWVGGSKTPPWKDVLSGEENDPKTPLGYFKQHWGDGWDKIRAPLTPSFHAALSEALGNFSLYCAGQIVDAFGGQLIYAGGDDVLAMLPADQALDCAEALQLVFRGIDPRATGRASIEVQDKLKNLFEFPAPGFVRCLKGTGFGDHCRPTWPLMTPGPAASASAGIAIGHVRSPMQDVIQSARDAEHDAKGVEGKGAFALRILKRSGESVQFSARFDSGVTGVWSELAEQSDMLSSRFIYRFLSKLQPALTKVVDGRRSWEPEWHTSGIDLDVIAREELRHSLENQSHFKKAEAKDRAERWLSTLKALVPEDFLHFWMARAFLNRLKESPSNR